MRYELLIVGGGPAGLSSALVAGRARRRAIVIDGGTPRNAAAPAMHSYLSRDGIVPKAFRAIGHTELDRYATVQRRSGMVRGIRPDEGGFEVDVDGTAISTKKVLLALGLVDTLPDIEGLRDAWGKGAHHCPFCDGFEHRDQHWGVLVDQPAMWDHALFLKNWAGGMTAFVATDDVPSDKVAALREAGIGIESAPIARVLGGDGHSLKGIEMRDGRRVAIESLWLRTVQRQTDLVHALGLSLREDGAIQRDEWGETSIPGIYAAGDCSAGGMQQAILAAGEGARVTLPLTHALAMSRA